LATPFGSLLSGPLADYLGRRRTLIISVIPLLFGWSTLAIARSVKVVIFARFLCGFATGILGGPGQVSDCHARAQCHWPGVRSHGTHEIPGTNRTVRDCPSDPLTVIGRALNSHKWDSRRESKKSSRDRWTGRQLATWRYIFYCPGFSGRFHCVYSRRCLFTSILWICPWLILRPKW